MSVESTPSNTSGPGSVSPVVPPSSPVAPPKKEEPGQLMGRDVQPGPELPTAKKVDDVSEAAIVPPPAIPKKTIAPAAKEPSAGLKEARKKMTNLAEGLGTHLTGKPMPPTTGKQTVKVKVPVKGSQEEPSAMPGRPSRARASKSTPTSAEVSPAYTRLGGRKDGVDLKTDQSPEANRVAAEMEADIMAGMAHAEGSLMTGILPRDNPPVEQMKKMVSSLAYVASAMDLRNPNDCKLMNAVAGLMTKGFGIGVGRFVTGWKTEWSDLGNKNAFSWAVATSSPSDPTAGLTWEQAGLTLAEMKKVLGRDDITERAWKGQKLEARDLEKMKDTGKFPGCLDKINHKLDEIHALELPKNLKLQRTLLDMLGFLQENKSRLVTTESGRHAAGVDLSIVQMEATLGQLVHDFILEAQGPTAKLPSALMIRDYMQTHEMIRPETFREITRLEKNMRNNPLLAEATNGLIKADIVGALQKPPPGQTPGKLREDMVLLLKSQLTDQARKQGIEISSDHLTVLVDKILDNYIAEIKGMKVTEKTGERGRVGLDRSFGAAAGVALAGSPGEQFAFAVMPDRADDAAVAAWAEEVLKDPATEAFAAAAKGKDGILSHIGSPTNVLRLGKGLDSAFLALAEHPEILLQKAIESMLPRPAEVLSPEQMQEANLLAALRLDFEAPSEPGRVNAQQEQLKEIIGNINVQFNDATKQKMPLGKMARMDSVASIMRQAHLRTICSVSGTTVDACVGMMLSMGKENMQRLLQPLLNYAKKFDTPAPTPPPTLNSPEADGFKQLLTTISFFMQTGQYHTAGEVLGGLFIVARGLFTTDAENMNIDQTFKMFEGLMREFAESPERFLAVNADDTAKIKAGLVKPDGLMQKLEVAAGKRAIVHRRELRDMEKAKKLEGRQAAGKRIDAMRTADKAERAERAAAEKAERDAMAAAEKEDIEARTNVRPRTPPTPPPESTSGKSGA